MNISHLISKIPFRETYIFFLGVFSMGWLVSFMTTNINAETWSGFGIIMSFVFIIFYSGKNKVEQELKNAKKMAK